MKDAEHTIAIVVDRSSKKGAVRAHDQDNKMVLNVTINPVQKNAGSIEMIFLL